MAERYHEAAFPQPMVEREGRLEPVESYGFGGMSRLELAATLLHAANCVVIRSAPPSDDARAWALSEARAWLDYLDAHQHEKKAAKAGGAT